MHSSSTSLSFMDSDNPFPYGGLSEAKLAVHNVQVVSYCSTAAIAILLYDYVITFDLEVEAIWKSKLNLAKLLFLINRYFGPIPVFIHHYTYAGFHPDLTFCSVWYKINVVMAFASLGIIETILVLRTWAIYDRTKFAFRGLTTLALVVFATMFGTIVYILSRLEYTEPPIYIMPGCYYKGPTQIYWIFWLPLLIFDTVIYVLTMNHACRTARGRAVRTQLHILYRDGVVHYILIFLATIANMLAYSLGEPELQPVAFQLLRVTLTAMCSRILLNIRRVVEGQSTLPDITPIQFGRSDMEQEMYSLGDEVPFEVAVEVTVELDVEEKEPVERDGIHGHDRITRTGIDGFA